MALGRFNSKVTNKVARPVAAWAPFLGVLHHTGRKSHRPYETPVNVFVDGDRYLIALTYGPGTDWCRNILAAGGCRFTSRGSTVFLTDPQVVDRSDESGALPGVVNRMLDVIGVDQLLVLRRA